MDLIYALLIKLIPEKRKNLILNSFLFDWEWYKKVHGLNGSKEEIYKHYIKNGQSQTYSPSTLFYPKHYKNSFQVKNSLNLTLLEHFLIFGWKKGMSPTPYFDLNYYLQNNPDVADSKTNPLIHFLEYGWKEGRNPNPYFHTLWYLETNLDVKEKEINPLIHYIETGYKEGRSPSPEFDNNWYKTTYLKNSDINPLGHYLSYGIRKEHKTHSTSFAFQNNSTIRNNSCQNLILEELNKSQIPGPFFIERTTEEWEWNYVLKYIAFYLPQFHEIEENNKWWEPGFTEWTNVSRGIPRFKGHYQPRLPRDLGFYDLTNVSIIKKQVELAKQYGVFGFCFHYYWFSGKRLLEKPLDLFLENKELDFPFCLCWANENWTRRWDGLDQEILMKQDFTSEDLESFIPDIAKYINDKRYIRINDRPIIIIYRPQLIPKVKIALKRWKEQAEELILGDPIWIAVQAFGLEDPNEVGFDVALEFPPHKLAKNVNPINYKAQILDNNFEGRIIDTIDLVKNSHYYSATTEFPLIKGVFPSWDNEARKKGNGTTFVNSSPLVFKKWIKACSRYAIENPVFNNSIVFINAWNEWAEGAYLEPDRHHGYAYLDVVKNVASTYNLLNPLNQRNENSKGIKNQYKFLIVSHDAHRHGAQLNILGFIKTLKRQFGYEVSVILLDGGALEPEFRYEANTFCLHGRNLQNAEDLREFLFGLELNGYEYAICNTTVTGSITPLLQKEGFKIISLIHELPSLIREFKLEDSCKKISENAFKIIFASNTVKNGFLNFSNPQKEKLEILPQGVYAFDLDTIEETPTGVMRRELDIPKDSKIILTIGFADLRKGVDLFVRVANKMTSRKEDLHFVWIGNYDSLTYHWIKHDTDLLPNKEKIHFLPFKKNISSYIKDSDLYLLTSREDPFPTVVLEALAYGKPVITFENNGGISELNSFDKVLEIVPYLDLDKMVQAANNLLYEANRKYDSLSKKGRSLIREKFRYDDYCFNVISNFELNVKKVTVIVPNYNYAHTLKERLTTIWQQDYPIFEIILLDDKSTDDSLDKIEELCSKHGKKIRLFVNEDNSGSPFAQWKKGIEKARGEFIWIAEADDLSKSSFLSELLSFFEQNGHLGMVYCQSEQIDEHGKFLAPDYKYYTEDISRSKWNKDYIEQGIEEIKSGLSIKNTILNVSSVLWKKDALKEIVDKEYEKIRSFSVAGDWYLYLKFLKNYSIGYSCKSLNIHRRHIHSATHSLKAEKHLNEIKNIHSVIDSIITSDYETKKKRERYLNKVEKHLLNKSQDKS